METTMERERDTMETTMEKETPWKQQWRERDTMETTMEIDFIQLQIWSTIVKGSFIRDWETLYFSTWAHILRTLSSLAKYYCELSC
jgi:hypothetical protein